MQLTEVSLTATVAANEKGGGLGFLRRHAGDLNQSATNTLGRDFQGFTLRLVSNPLVQVGDGNPSNVLSNAGVDLAIEAAEQAGQSIGLQMITKWPRAEMPTSGLPQAVRDAVGDMLRVNTTAEPPSRYIVEAYGYLQQRALGFLKALADS